METEKRENTFLLVLKNQSRLPCQLYIKNLSEQPNVYLFFVHFRVAVLQSSRVAYTEIVSWLLKPFLPNVIAGFLKTLQLQNFET
jgi:hypothetical protein